MSTAPKLPTFATTFVLGRNVHLQVASNQYLHTESPFLHNYQERSSHLYTHVLRSRYRCPHSFNPHLLPPQPQANQQPHHQCRPTQIFAPSQTIQRRDMDHILQLEVFRSQICLATTITRTTQPDILSSFTLPQIPIHVHRMSSRVLVDPLKAVKMLAMSNSSSAIQDMPNPIRGTKSRSEVVAIITRALVRSVRTKGTTATSRTKV